MSALFRRISGAGLFGTTLNQAAILLSGMGSGITLARSLGTEGRGEFAIALLWPGIVLLIGDLGLGFALSYYSGKGEDRIDELWTVALLSSLLGGGILALCGWVLIPHLVPSLHGAALRELGLALVSVPLMLANGFQAYILLGRGFVREYNAIRINTAINYLLFVLAVALLNAPSVHNYVVAYIAAQFTGLLLCTVLVIRHFSPRWRLNGDVFRKIFFYGVKTQVASIAAQTNLRADQAVMSIILTPAQLGLYVVAVSMSGVLTPFMSALAVVILPRTTHAESATAGALLVAKHVKLACLLCSPVLAFSIALIPWVLPGLFGKEYAGAVLSAQVLIAASLFQGLNAVLGNSLRGLGRPGLPAVAEGLGMVVTLSLLFLLLRPLGILGAALASLAAYFVVSALLFLLVARVGGVSFAHLAFSPLSDISMSGAWQRFRTSIGWHGEV